MHGLVDGKHKWKSNHSLNQPLKTKVKTQYCTACFLAIARCRLLWMRMHSVSKFLPALEPWTSLSMLRTGLATSQSSVILLEVQMPKMFVWCHIVASTSPECLECVCVLETRLTDASRSRQKTQKAEDFPNNDTTIWSNFAVPNTDEPVPVKQQHVVPSAHSL